MLSKVGNYAQQAEQGIIKAQQAYNSNKDLIQNTYNTVKNTAAQVQQLTNQVKNSGLIGKDEDVCVLRSGKRVGQARSK